MQASSAIPLAAGAILLATVTLNAANPKRNKTSKAPGAGASGFGSSGPGGRQINHNRAMSFTSQEFGGSLSSSARRSPSSQSFSRGHSSSRHSRTQSLNRNLPHTPSATTSMGEMLHSRNPSTGGTAQNRGTRRQQGGSSGNSTRVQRKPGHYPSQSLPEFTYPGASRSSVDARRPAFTNATGFLRTGDSGSENRDQRLPPSLF